MSEEQIPGDRVVGRYKHGELTVDDLASLTPGLGALMPVISQRYWILYHAAQGGNWGLAAYQLSQIRHLLSVGATTRPKMARYLKAFIQGHLEAIRQAVEAQDLERFERAHRKGADAANTYHRETGHPEVVWQLPPDPPAHLRLTSPD